MEKKSLSYKLVRLIEKVLRSPHGRYTDHRKIKRVANIAQRLTRQRRKVNNGGGTPAHVTGRVVAADIRQSLLLA